MPKYDTSHSDLILVHRFRWRQGMPGVHWPARGARKHRRYGFCNAITISTAGMPEKAPLKVGDIKFRPRTQGAVCATSSFCVVDNRVSQRG
jgi:hypothetical protein